MSWVNFQDLSGSLTCCILSARWVSKALKMRVTSFSTAPIFGQAEGTKRLGGLKAGVFFVPFWESTESTLPYPIFITHRPQEVVICQSAQRVYHGLPSPNDSRLKHWVYHMCHHIISQNLWDGLWVAASVHPKVTFCYGSQLLTPINLYISKPEKKKAWFHFGAIPK